MIDIKFLRENPEAVKENIRKKFQDQHHVRFKVCQRKSRHCKAEH